MSEKLVTIKEAADILDVSVATIYNLMKRGTLQKIVAPVGRGKGGLRTFFDRKAVESLARQMRGAAK